MEDNRDRLGRRIPQFDRRAAAIKANQTLKRKRGKNYHAKLGAKGGRARGGLRYYSQLKAEGRTEELVEIARRGAIKSAANRKARSAINEEIQVPAAKADV